MKTVKDIIELIDEKTYVVLDHYEEDDRHGIYREISERSRCKDIKDFYGLNKMGEWKIESIEPYTENNDLFIRIRYSV